MRTLGFASLAFAWLVALPLSAHAFRLLVDDYKNSLNHGGGWVGYDALRINPDYKEFTFYVSEGYFDINAGRVAPITDVHVALVKKAFEILEKRASEVGLKFTYGGTYARDSMKDLIEGGGDSTLDDRMDKKIYLDFMSVRYKFGKKGPFATGHPYKSSKSGTKAGGGIVRFNGKLGEYLRPTQSELVKTVIHEVLHALGVGHSTVATSVMSYNSLAYYTIGEDDVLALKNLYSTSSATTTELNVQVKMDGQATQGVEVVMMDTTTGKSFVVLSADGTAQVRALPAGSYWVAAREFSEATAGPCFDSKTKGFLTSFYQSDTAATNVPSQATSVALTVGSPKTLVLNLIAGKKNYDCYAGNPMVGQPGTLSITSGNMDTDLFQYYVRPGLTFGMQVQNERWLTSQGLGSKTSDTNPDSGYHSSIVISSVGSNPSVKVSESNGTTEPVQGTTKLTARTMPDALPGTYAAVCEAKGEYALISTLTEVKEYGGYAYLPSYVPELKDSFDYSSRAINANESQQNPASGGIVCGLWSRGEGDGGSGEGGALGGTLELVALVLTAFLATRRWVPARAPLFAAGAMLICFAVSCAKNDSSSESSSGGSMAPNQILRGEYWATSISDDPEWKALPTAGAPSAREGHTAVWTGTEMIVWGGSGTIEPYLRDGGRYDPATDKWKSMSAPPASFPERSDHLVVWTGAKMLVFGGRNSSGPLGDGAAYDPANDTWTLLATAGAPAARVLGTAVWTGTKMLVWGGRGSGESLATGASYDPSSDTWSSISTAGAPSGRYGHQAVWTGSKMWVWGGDSGAATSPFLATGGLYDSANDTWTVIGSTGAPDARTQFSVAYKNGKVYLVGGIGATAWKNDVYSYTVASDSWTKLERDGGTGLWILAGAPIVVMDSMILAWGGFTRAESDATLGPYSAGVGIAIDTARGVVDFNASYEAMVDPSFGFKGHTAVWTGTQLLVWGGSGTSWIADSDMRTNTGARYTPSKK